MISQYWMLNMLKWYNRQYRNTGILKYVLLNYNYENIINNNNIIKTSNNMLCVCSKSMVY